MAKPIIGLALGGGAARGMSHIGVLDVLDEVGIQPDVIAGCSIGSFVGAAYLTGHLSDVRDWAEAVTWYDVVKLLDVSLSGGGLIAGKLIEQLMADLGITGNIADLSKPFASVATDYLTGREEWHRSGPIGKAVRASMSAPGILTPVNIDGDWFVDGSLVNPVPVSTCRALGANIIIAVNLNGDLVGRRELPSETDKKNPAHLDIVEKAVSAIPDKWRPNTAEVVNEFLRRKPTKPGYFDVLFSSLNIMQDRITRSRLAGDPPHVMITPHLTSMGILDFDQSKLAIEEGRKCARYALPEINRLLLLSGEGFS